MQLSSPVRDTSISRISATHNPLEQRRQNQIESWEVNINPQPAQSRCLGRLTGRKERIEKEKNRIGWTFETGSMMWNEGGRYYHRGR